MTETQTQGPHNENIIDDYPISPALLDNPPPNQRNTHTTGSTPLRTKKSTKTNTKQTSHDTTKQDNKSTHIG